MVDVARYPIRTASEVAKDIDRSRPNVCGICPVCGGGYAAGYKEPPRHTEITIVHTVPACETFTESPADFLRRAREMGAVRMRLP